MARLLIAMEPTRRVENETERFFFMSRGVWDKGHTAVPLFVARAPIELDRKFHRYLAVYFRPCAVRANDRMYGSVSAPSGRCIYWSDFEMAKKDVTEMGGGSISELGVVIWQSPTGSSGS
jgi:hypothetical protein